MANPNQKAPEEKLVEYKALGNLKHAEKAARKGDIVQLTEKQAEPLLKLKAIVQLTK